MLDDRYQQSGRRRFSAGDGYNDLPMIEFAGLGVAMGNAVDEVKAAANYVTATNDEDGIAQVIEKFILNN